MAEELGTKDVLEQVDARIGNVEQDVRDLRVEMNAGFGRVDNELGNLRKEMRSGFERIDTRFERIDARFERIDSRFGSQTRWTTSLIFASWLTLIASFWLKG